MNVGNFVQIDVICPYGTRVSVLWGIVCNLYPFLCSFFKQ